MKGYEWIGWIVTVFLGLTIISNIMAAAGYVSATDLNLLQALKVTQTIKIAWFTISIPGLGFFPTLYKMMITPYNTIFTGNAQFIYFILQTVTFMVGFALLMTLISIAVNAFRVR